MSGAALVDLKNDTGIEDFVNLKKEDIAKIFAKISNNELSENTLIELIKVSPSFVNAFASTISGIYKVISDSSQHKSKAYDSLRALDDIVKPLGEAAGKCQADECRANIANTIRDVVFKVCETTSSMHAKDDKSNSEFINAIGLLGISILAAVFLLRTPPKATG